MSATPNASANPPAFAAGSAPQDPHSGRTGHASADSECPWLGPATGHPCSLPAGHDGGHLYTPPGYTPTEAGAEWARRTTEARSDAGTPEDVYHAAAQAYLRAQGAVLPHGLELRAQQRAQHVEFRAAVDAARAPLATEVHDLRLIFDLGFARMGDATERWRAEDPTARALVMPDLGDLLKWLMADADKARVERDEARRQLAEATAATEGGEWVTEWGYLGDSGGEPYWRSSEEVARDGIENDGGGTLIQRRIWYGPATPTTEAAP